MRVGTLGIVVALGACNHGTAATPPDAAPAYELPLSIDVVAGSAYASIYLNGSDFVTHANPVDDELLFPRVGECITTTDGFAGELSCVRRVAYIANGERHEVAVDPVSPYGFEVPAPVPDDLALEIEGCGPEPVHVPLTVLPAARPILDVQPLSDGYYVSWTSEQPWDSVLVFTGYGLHGLLCHQTASSYTIPGAPYDVRVTLLRGPVETQGSWGIARVWSGAGAYQRLMP